LWKKVRLGELLGPEASLAIALLVRADIELVPMRSVARRALDLSVALDHPAYDCMYLALAEATGRPFVTADARLLRKVAAAGAIVQPIDVIDLARFAADAD
jgi:predicted nucleic acid-binding protein